MRLLNKLFEFENRFPLTAEYIEQCIKNLGYEPLRWAIVKADNKNIKIESTIIESKIQQF